MTMEHDGFRKYDEIVRANPRIQGRQLPVFTTQLVNITIVRDDYLPGGSKRRFLDDFVMRQHPDVQEFVYASSAYGGAQVALAHACARAGKQAIVFVPLRKQLHARSAEAQEAGAVVVQVPCGYRRVLEKRARDYCAAAPNRRHLMPFGFSIPDACQAIAAAASCVRQSLGKFDEVWAAAGSGLLIRALQQAQLGETYCAVAVGGQTDLDAGAAQVIHCSIPFEKNARVMPPFPSCSNYDAKVWEYLQNRPAHLRILFWNCMR